MAINKVVNKQAKSHGAMRNVIEYVLQDKKVREGYVEITGPFPYERINWDNVYKAFLNEKKIWNKTSAMNSFPTTNVLSLSIRIKGICTVTSLQIQFHL